MFLLYDSTIFQSTVELVFALPDTQGRIGRDKSQHRRSSEFVRPVYGRARVGVPGGGSVRRHFFGNRICLPHLPSRHALATTSLAATYELRVA